MFKISSTENLMIRRANEADLEGILKLQAANQRSAGGSLSASISPANLMEMVRTMPVIVALASDKVVGFLIISTAAMNAGLPIIQDMLRAYPIDAETFISGPICISADMRGKGIAKELFRELGRIRPGIRCICFIRRDNLSSLLAHTKIGWKEMGHFIFNQTDHAILIYTA
jgi:predicted GNAT superfamily acetyltransferase